MIYLDNMQRALVVDYDPHYRLKIHQILSELSYHVDSVETGTLALELASGTGYDLAILDYMLPDINGFRLALQLRKKNGDVPVVVITAHEGWALMDRHVKEVTGMEGLGVLVRPFETDALIQKINEVTEKKDEA